MIIDSKSSNQNLQKDSEVKNTPDEYINSQELESRKLTPTGVNTVHNNFMDQIRKKSDGEVSNTYGEEANFIGGQLESFEKSKPYRIDEGNMFISNTKPNKCTSGFNHTQNNTANLDKDNQSKLNEENEKQEETKIMHFEQNTTSNTTTRLNFTPNNGLCGLKNIGNSCYMNSALQALCHTPEIKEYFLKRTYYEDKNENNLNCNISEELQTIVAKLWNGNHSPYNPKDFKSKAKEYIELLDNNEHQDSAEFLIQLLELIHNELTGKTINKTGRFKNDMLDSSTDSKNKANETKNYKEKSLKRTRESIKIEESIISKNIQGKYSKTMMCENCNDKSSSEDNFTVLSLQIPSIKQLMVHVKFYPAEPIDMNIMIDYDFMFDSDQSCISEIENKLKLCDKEGVHYEYYTRSDSNNELISLNKCLTVKELGDINESKLQAVIYLYELSSLKMNWDYFDFELCTEDNCGETQQQTSVFKIPIDVNGSLLELHKAVYKRLVHCIRMYSEDYFDENFQNDVIEKETRYYRIEFNFRPTNSKKCPIHQTKKSHVCEIYVDENITFKQLLEIQDYSKISFSIVIFESKSNDFDILETNKQSLNYIKINTAYDSSLISCFLKFVADEIRPDYSCDKCGKVTNYITRRTVLSLPKYLILKLVRFQFDNSTLPPVSKKDEQFVDFPIKDLDLTSIYNCDKSSISCTYDLYGVIYHSGELGVGHYYSKIRNNLDSDIWYLFDDESVEPCTETDIVNDKAYILFYVKR